MKNKKKQKTKNNYQANKKRKTTKTSQECYRYLSEDEKIKKRNCANIRNKNMSDADRKRKKEYMKNYYDKRKKNC